MFLVVLTYPHQLASLIVIVEQRNVRDKIGLMVKLRDDCTRFIHKEIFYTIFILDKDVCPEFSRSFRGLDIHQPKSFVHTNVRLKNTNQYFWKTCLTDY